MQQQSNGDKLPVGFWSRGLSAQKKNLFTVEKEVLPVVWSILRLRTYLYGDTFILRTDHHALILIRSIADSSVRLARWRLQLAKYDNDVEYRPELTRSVAEGVFRLRKSKKEHDVIDDESPGFVMEGSPNGDTAHLKHCEAVIAF